jgi:hypothetical protein
MDRMSPMKRFSDRKLDVRTIGGPHKAQENPLKGHNWVRKIMTSLDNFMSDQLMTASSAEALRPAARIVE